MNPVPLSTCPCADRTDVVVCQVGGDAEHKLRDIGVREGVTLSVLNNDSNVIVRLAGCRIGLRREVASCVMVTPAKS